MKTLSSMLVAVCAFVSIYASSASSATPDVVKALDDYAWDSFWTWGNQKVTRRYGNWLGEGWWGGSELDDCVGLLPPIDDLDALAQQHDFGYAVAEKLGKGSPVLEAYYKAMADTIAIEDTLKLPADTSKWKHPPKDPDMATTFMDRLTVSFFLFQKRKNQLKAAILGGKVVLSNPAKFVNEASALISERKMRAEVLAMIEEWEIVKKKLSDKKVIAKEQENRDNYGIHSLMLELPGYWGHLPYFISGAVLEPPTGGDTGNVAGRSYVGKLLGPMLTISATGISDNESSGPNSGDYYMLSGSVAVGQDTKNFDYIAPKGEKLNKSFALSVPVPPGATNGSFSIKLLEVNRNYGNYGWVVSGSLSGMAPKNYTSSSMVMPKATKTPNFFCTDRKN